MLVSVPFLFEPLHYRVKRIDFSTFFAMYLQVDVLMSMHVRFQKNSVDNASIEVDFYVLNTRNVQLCGHEIYCRAVKLSIDRK